jgi:hypothetical protein
MPKATTKTKREGEGEMLSPLPKKRFMDACGTSLSAYIFCTYAALVSLLGEPNSDSDGHKIDAEWILDINGKIVTIYNYKDGKNYNGEDGLDVEDITQWHIGSKEDVEEEVNFLQKKLNPKKEYQYRK